MRSATAGKCLWQATGLCKGRHMTHRVLDGVHVDDVGEGDPLVVFPGGPARHPDYLERLGGLDQAGYRLLLVHPRGIGASPVPDDHGQLAASRQVDDVEALRARLGLERITLVSHSAGTGLALGYAARFPARLARLVLVNPSTRVLRLQDTPEEYEAQVAPMRAESWYPAARAALDAMETRGPTPELRAASRPLLYGEWTPRAQEHAAHDPEQSTALARAHWFDDEPDPAQVREAMAQVTCPVRIIIGEVDPAPGPELADRLAALFPDARVLTVPGAGHFGWVTRPTAFGQVLRTALGDAAP